MEQTQYNLGGGGGVKELFKHDLTILITFYVYSELPLLPKFHLSLTFICIIVQSLL